MKTLSKLHEEFIDVARRPMDFGQLPVIPLEVEKSVIVVDKWREVGTPKMLEKKFRFQKLELRNEFVLQLLEYETEKKHPATIIINDDLVTLRLITRNIEHVTGVDKDYAKFADMCFKDVVYNKTYE